MKLSVEVDKYSATSLVHVLSELEVNIPDFDEWRFFVNAGGIDYGIFLNFDIKKKEIEICNQPDGEDVYLNDVIELCADDDEGEDEYDDDEEE